VVGSNRLAYWSHFITRSSRNFRGGGGDDLVQMGWVSVMARGNTGGVRQTQAGLRASDRAPR